jgi:hypothetical protein
MDLYKILFYSHSGFRYIVFALLILVLGASLIGWFGKKPYTNTDNKLSLFLFISVHVMATIGTVLYFLSPAVVFASTMMKNPTQRYWTVEHITANLIAVVFITLARTTSKRMVGNDLSELGTRKHKRMFVFTAIGVVILIVSLTSHPGGSILVQSSH